MSMPACVQPYMEIYYAYMQSDIMGSRIVGPLASRKYISLYYIILCCILL